MKRDHIFLIFTLFFALLSIYLLYVILSPFLASLIWAVLLALVFYPLFDRFQRFLKKGILSALLMTLLVLFVIVLPFSLLIVSLASEVVDVYHWVQKMTETGEFKAYIESLKRVPFLEGMILKLNQYFDFSEIDPAGYLLKNLQQISTFLFNHTTRILKGISTFIFGFFFTMLSLYYLFKDGNRLFESVKEMIPVPSREKDLLIRRFKDMIDATIYGGILIALIQGVLGGLSFWGLGFSSPVFWGTAMVFLSFIPVGGTALVWIPASIYLFVQGAFVKGIILLGLGVFIIGMVDNFLRPYLLSTRTHIHPLMLFFAVLGGIDAFGLIGLVAGPLIVTLFLTLVEIYSRGIRTEEDNPSA